MITNRNPSAYKVSIDPTARPTCLDIRTAAGRVGYPYAQLRLIALHGPELAIFFDRRKCTVHGTNLEPLYEALLEKTVIFINETPALTGTGNQTVIVRIEIVDLGSDGGRPQLGGGPGSGALVAP